MTQLRSLALLCRYAVHVDLAAARLGCSPRDYFAVHPKMRFATALKARRDVRDALAGRLPHGGLTDAEALHEARLWQAAWACAVSYEGNIRADKLRAEAARLRIRGLSRAMMRAMAECIEEAA